MITKSKKTSGFTLVELLLFIGLFSILLTVLTQMFVTIVETQLDSQSSSSVSQDSRYIFNRLSYDIHRSTNLNSPSVIGIDSPTISLKIGLDNYVYKQQDDNLLLNINGTDYQLNSYTTSISNLNFQRLGDPNTSPTPIIKISYTITSNIQEVSGQETRNIETVIGLRPQP